VHYYKRSESRPAPAFAASCR